MTRDEALRLAQYALHGGVTMELPPDSGRIRKIADSILDAHKEGSQLRRNATFTNENGRAINIEVTQTDAPGDVRFVIRGPHSESENIVTRMEAVELHRLLGAYLDAQQPTPASEPAPEIRLRDPFTGEPGDAAIRYEPQQPTPDAEPSDTELLNWQYSQGVELRCHVEGNEDGLETWFTPCVTIKGKMKALSHPYEHPRDALKAAMRVESEAK